jgi:ribosomal protein L17
MAEAKDVRVHIEHLIERAQDEILDASRQLADGISKETDRFVPPISQDVEGLVDDVFDFAERVMKGQRAMVRELVKTINEQSRRAAEVGREATGRIKKAPAKRKAVARKGAVAKRGAVKKAPAKKAAPKKKAVAKRGAAKKAPAKKRATASR